MTLHRIIFLFGLLLCSNAVFGQTGLGVGLVDVEFNDKTVIHFYDRPGQQKPAKTIYFYDDVSVKSWNIRDLESVKNWLVPESLWLDYGSFVFRCRSRRPGWFEVIVNNDAGTAYWIKKSDALTFYTWEDFLKSMFAVKRSEKFPQKIRLEAKDSAGEVGYKGVDCFVVKSMAGDWIEVESADYCANENIGSTPFGSGWIKWRSGDRLLIEYFITS